MLAGRVPALFNVVGVTVCTIVVGSRMKEPEDGVMIMVRILALFVAGPSRDDTPVVDPKSNGVG